MYSDRVGDSSKTVSSELCFLVLMLSTECAVLCAVLSRCSCVLLFVTLWTAAHQVPLSTRFSRQEYWSGLSCSPPGVLPDPGIELHLLCLLHWQAGSLPLAPPGRPATECRLYLMAGFQQTMDKNRMSFL